MGPLRCTSLLREVVEGKCVSACRCESVRPAGIYFQGGRHPPTGFSRVPHHFSTRRWRRAGRRSAISSSPNLCAHARAVVPGKAESHPYVKFTIRGLIGTLQASVWREWMKHAPTRTISRARDQGRRNHLNFGVRLGGGVRAVNLSWSSNPRLPVNLISISASRRRGSGLRAPAH